MQLYFSSFNINITIENRLKYFTLRTINPQILKTDDTAAVSFLEKNISISKDKWLHQLQFMFKLLCMSRESSRSILLNIVKSFMIKRCSQVRYLDKNLIKIKNKFDPVQLRH